MIIENPCMNVFHYECHESRIKLMVLTGAQSVTGERIFFSLSAYLFPSNQSGRGHSYITLFVEDKRPRKSGQIHETILEAVATR